MESAWGCHFFLPVETRAAIEVHTTFFFFKVPCFGSSRHALLNPKNWFDPG